MELLLTWQTRVLKIGTLAANALRMCERNPVERNQRFTVTKEIAIQWGTLEDSQFVKSEYSANVSLIFFGFMKKISAVIVGDCHLGATSLKGPQGLLKVDK